LGRVGDDHTAFRQRPFGFSMKAFEIRRARSGSEGAYRWFRPPWITLSFVLLLTNANATDAAAQSSIPECDTSRQASIFFTDWRCGIPNELSLQIAVRDDIVVVNDPDDRRRNALKVSIALEEDYSRLVNGSPRAEIAFLGQMRFETGNEYIIRWSTFIPDDYVSDPDESVVITQIHQGGCCSGPPPVMLTIRGMHYEFAERSGAGKVRQHRLSEIAADLGRWVTWVLRYRPDPSGSRARTELKKDGLAVFNSKGIGNAYPDGQSSYLKIGLYKSTWVGATGRPDRITLFYGPVSIKKVVAGSSNGEKQNVQLLN
jgi:hypothetical protein